VTRMKRRVVVTGLGVVTSLGRAVETFWDRVVRGESGVGPISLFDVSGYRVQFGGQVPWEPEKEDIAGPKELKRLDRFTQFAIASAKDAVADSGIDFSKEEPFRCGVVIGSGIGGLWEFEVQEERLLHKGIDKVSPFTIPKLMVNSASGHVSSLYGIKGPNFAVATACASAANSIGSALRAIQYGDADVMVTGGSEAALTPIGLAGFQNMRALSFRGDAPQQASRPFDADRDGFVLAEGAGVVVLEELEHARARGARIYGELRSAMRRSIPRPCSTSTPTAPAPRWATRPRRRRSRRCLASRPASWPCRAPRASSGTPSGPAEGSNSWCAPSRCLTA
jgi:3-oxoacyl-[acyl-carrier-protein] synthase II